MAKIKFNTLGGTLERCSIRYTALEPRESLISHLKEVTDQREGPRFARMDGPFIYDDVVN